MKSIYDSNGFFYVKNNVVCVSDKYKVIKELYELEKNVSEVRFGKFIDYIHFVYSKKSPYFGIVFKDRKKIVCQDRFGDPNVGESIEKIKEVRTVIDRMNQFQFTENETFLEGVRHKISEYLEYWNTNKISKDNSSDLIDQLKGAKELLKVKKEMEEMVYEEIRRLNADRESGKKLFEE